MILWFLGLVLPTSGVLLLVGGILVDDPVGVLHVVVVVLIPVIVVDVVNAVVDIVRLDLVLLHIVSGVLVDGTVDFEVRRRLRWLLRCRIDVLGRRQGIL